MSESLPDPDVAGWPASLAADHLLRLDPTTVLWRVYPKRGERRLRWDQGRAWGPTQARFDTHPEPPGRQPEHAIWYGALETPLPRQRGLTTAIAERFQETRAIPASNPDIGVVRTTPTADLTLLDLDSSWTTQAGGNAAIASGPRDQARSWARLIRARYPVEGVAWKSSVYPPGTCVAIWAPRPGWLSPPTLNSDLPDLIRWLVPIATELSYTLLVD